MRVLLIEDERTLAESIEVMLMSAKCEVAIAALGEDGLRLAREQKFDLVLLDLNLPDMSGYDVLKALRRSLVQVPVLILSGWAGIDDKVKGLGLGADDYVTKPFHKDELVARIHAIVRRSQGEDEGALICGDLILKPKSHGVEVAGRPVNLTRKEYEMLECLAVRQGSTITKEMFLNAMYGGMDEPELKIIDVFICKLRKKLGDASGGKNYIETVWGRGYRLVPAEQVRPTPETRVA
jgi:two-component system cell cycle response regulator CtrA